MLCSGMNTVRAELSGINQINYFYSISNQINYRLPTPTNIWSVTPFYTLLYMSKSQLSFEFDSFYCTVQPQGSFILLCCILGHSFLVGTKTILTTGSGVYIL